MARFKRQRLNRYPVEVNPEVKRPKNNLVDVREGRLPTVLREYFNSLRSRS